MNGLARVAKGQIEGQSGLDIEAATRPREEDGLGVLQGVE
jgi:hypothetical protein